MKNKKTDSIVSIQYEETFLKRENARSYLKVIAKVIIALGLEWRPSAEK